MVMEVKCVLKHHIPGLGDWGWGSTFDVCGARLPGILKQGERSLLATFFGCVQFILKCIVNAYLPGVVY